MTATEDHKVTLPAFLDGEPKKHLINGRWVPSLSGATFSTLNPSTGERLADISEADEEDVNRAVAAARAAFEGPWSRFTPAQREDALLRLADLVAQHYDELRVLDVLEMGSPIGHPGLGRDSTVSRVRYYAGWATKIHGETVTPSTPGSFFTCIVKEPVGVVAAIIPWNGPLSSALAKIAPALATGCTLVLKPAEEASLSALRIGELIQSLDLPDGVVNIVTGGEPAGAALTHHLDVDKIAFTGSLATGQKIIQASSGNLKRLTLELGGKSPNVIFGDADLEAAITGAGMGIFWNTGQVCSAGSRIFVERRVHDEVVDGIKKLALKLRVGNSLDPETEIGPVVSQQQLDRVTHYMQRGRDQGATALVGGSRLVDGALGDGYFVPPTVFTEVEDDMDIARDEIFGPVASIMPFDDVDEVISRANATPFGLGAGVWTRDLGKAHRLAAAIRAGVVWVNTYNKFDAAMPFGGYKMSGWGRKDSVHSLDEYLHVKGIWINTD